MYVPRTAPAGVGEETAHRVGRGKAGFLPAGRSSKGWMGSATVAVARRPSVCRRHGDDKYDYGKNHNRNKQTGPES